MSESLIKIFDYSILPAALLIAGKLTGVLVALKAWDLPWEFRDYSQSLFEAGTSVRAEDLKLVASVSDVVMYIFVATYFSITVIRAVFFHNTHVKPALVTKLANQSLLKLIQTSYDIYHSGATNLVFLWLATALIAFNVATERTELWIGVVSVVASIILTTLLLQDVYREIENIKHKPGRYEWV